MQRIRGNNMDVFSLGACAKRFAYANVVAMNKTRTHLLLEERLGKDLHRHVEALRTSGKSWDAIVLDLYERTQVALSPATLRLWFKDMPRGNRNSEVA
jgi:hypothetical protein